MGGRVRVFITGATGFVGAHVAQLAAQEGAELRVLARPTSKLTHLPRHAEIVIGDLREPAAFAAALQGCDALIHVAADYRLWVPEPSEMYKANVEGTRELLRLAREAGVPRVVYTSSVATMGFHGDAIVDEQTPVSEAAMIGHYKRSKWLAEQVAMEAARAGQQVVILNPTTPIGSLDTKPTPTGRIIVDFLNRNFPAYVDTGLNLVDVEEIARMHLVALERGMPGERYILGGENLTLKEPRATVEAVRMGKKMMFASSAKAERDLGLQVKSVEAALRSACAWFVANGYAPAPPRPI